MSAVETRPTAGAGPRAGRDVSSARVLTLPSLRSSGLQIWNPVWLTVGATLALCALGLYCIHLTTGVAGVDKEGLVARQASFLVAGIIVAAAAAVPSYRVLGRLTPVLCVVTLAMLAFLLVPGVPEWLVRPRNGARRWINMGVAPFQPSELAKVVYVLAVARYLRFRRNHRRFFGLTVPAVITFVPMALILVEPDLGTALLFLPALFAMLIAAGAKLKHLLLVVVVALALAPAMYPLLQPHQKARVQALYYQLKGDTSHADSISYQGYRAMTLIGAGGVDGLAPDKSRAVIDFNELPEDHNDMIFSVVANRFGLVGGVFVMGVYLLWIGGAMWAAGACRDPFGRLVIVGLAAIVATQTVVNIGENIGVLPITGMTLPFVSYGGSSMLIGFLIVGLMFNVAMRPSPYLQRQSFEFSGPDDDA